MRLHKLLVLQDQGALYVKANIDCVLLLLVDHTEACWLMLVQLHSLTSQSAVFFGVM